MGMKRIKGTYKGMRFVRESTCEMVFSDEDGGWQCCNCGAVSYGIAAPGYEVLMPQYCPNCRARVLGEVEG